MAEIMNPWHIEQEYLERGYQAICGVDEAGAGPLAGPVYAAAVILPDGLVIEGLNDSKKLSEKKRDALYTIICKEARAYAIAFATEKEIDRINIRNARMLAMERAITSLSVKADFALIDGDCNQNISYPNVTIVGGDGKSINIAAASILAKVSRDRYLVEVLDTKYPQYQFARHKGYPTKLHYQMLDKYGPCSAHRKSFLKKWESRQK